MGDWSSLISSIAPSLVGLGTGLIMNNQNVQNAQGKANDTKEALQLQLQIAQENTKAQQLQNNLALAQLKNLENPTSQNSNTALYIGLGVGGVVLIGLIVFAVSRK